MPPRKPKAPRGPSRVTPIAGEVLPNCEAGDKGRCPRMAVVFNRWRWWCRTHDPGNEPDPNCGHSNPSRFGDRIMCSFCGGDLQKEAS